MREGQRKRRTNPVVMGCMLPVLVWLALCAIAWASAGIARVSDGAVVLLPERVVEAIPAVALNFAPWGWAPDLLLWGLAVAASKGAKAPDRCGESDSCWSGWRRPTVWPGPA